MIFSCLFPSTRSPQVQTKIELPYCNLSYCKAFFSPRFSVSRLLLLSFTLRWLTLIMLKKFLPPYTHCCSTILNCQSTFFLWLFYCWSALPASWNHLFNFYFYSHFYFLSTSNAWYFLLLRLRSTWVRSLRFTKHTLTFFYSTRLCK